jgi:hypothetical protein
LHIFFGSRPAIVPAACMTSERKIARRRQIRTTREKNFRKFQPLDKCGHGFFHGLEKYIHVPPKKSAGGMVSRRR